MNSLEKRHSGRRSSGHRKPSDGGHSEPFPDETDREVSNLTDRAFRSLCIGDEAVYNDSDLPAASPSGRTERQQAFCQGGRGWKREDAKRAAQERHGPEWPPGAQSQGDPGWAGTLDGRTGGRVSETSQHALVDGSLPQRPLNREPASPLSNGAPEFSAQGRRSRSRVSSLIKAFNSDGVRDGAVPDGKLKDEGNRDRSALMSIQRDVSEMSTAYGQSVNSDPFSPSGPCPSQESVYSSQVAATAHLDSSSSSSSFARSSHSQRSVTSLYGSGVPNVFVHSECSPFRVWRRPRDRYPHRHADVSGYADRSGFQTWYETPLYKELSLGPETRRVAAQEQWAAEPPPRKPLEHVALPPAPRSSSTSTVLHTASAAVQQRCESELAEFHTVRQRTQSLGNNKLPSQRPPAVSPAAEMRRRGREAIALNSVTDLRQTFRTTTSGRGVTAEVMGGPHGALPGNDGFVQFADCDSATAVAGAAVVGSNAYPAPFGTGQSHTLGVYAPQEVRASEVNQCALSPPAMEHAPVRAESRGATPDVRLSGYKARATSLLFNLRDNRKSVKSTYSPPRFIGLENFDRSKQVIKMDGMEPRDTVINIPEFQDSDLPQVVMQQGPSVDPHTPSHPPLTGHHSPGVTAFNPHLPAAYQVHRKDYVSGDHLKPLTQIDDDIKVKGKDELLGAEKINADPPRVDEVKDPFRTKPAPAEHAKVKIEKAKEEPNKAVTAGDEPPGAERGRARMEQAKEKREHAKALSEKRMEHSVESLLIRKAEKDKLKQEPGRVEKVKTELAKARAELAEFKEKMKEEQKVKQTKAIASKEVDKNILQKEKHPPPYQQTEETPVIVMVDEYERVREKYGFSETALANKNLASANDVASPSQDMEMSRPHSAKGEEASGISKPRDAENPQIATEDEAKRPNTKGEEFRENRYVYSETSKEFKLTSPYDSSSSLVTQQMDREIGVVKNTKDKVLNTKPGPVSKVQGHLVKRIIKKMEMCT
ncbi:unnamed protein product [Arctogadus glacialis]